MTKKDYLEADLYKPVKDFFEALGYNVKAEVKDCDIAMVKGEQLIIIELKKSFNISLVYQLMDRQRITSQVYAAVPRPKRSRGGDYSNMLRLCRKLEVGLMTVAMDSPVRHVEILSFPPTVDKTEKARLKAGILNEIAGRTADGNVGGSNRKKLMTAYREKCIKVACALERAEICSPSQLMKLYGTADNTASILQFNSYHWFKRIDRGQYALTDVGREMLTCDEYAGFVEYYRKEIDGAVSVL